MLDYICSNGGYVDTLFDSCDGFDDFGVVECSGWGVCACVGAFACAKHVHLVVIGTTPQLKDQSQRRRVSRRYGWRNEPNLDWILHSFWNNIGPCTLQIAELLCTPLHVVLLLDIKIDEWLTRNEWWERRLDGDFSTEQLCCYDASNEKASMKGRWLHLENHDSSKCTGREGFLSWIQRSARRTRSERNSLILFVREKVPGTNIVCSSVHT